MEGKVDAFVAAAGTGGTFAGISSFLKERRESIWSRVGPLFSYTSAGSAAL